MGKYVTITEAAAALRSGETTAAELVEEAIAAADAADAGIGTFITRYNDQARAAAVDADSALAAGTAGPLTGIPLGIKDIITTREGPTTGQSAVQDLSWGDGDAVVVERLRSAGGIIMGKLATMEFACGLPDAEKPFPFPRNPWNLDTWPGGSSSGTGSGVAAGMFLGGLGTDTGGSIRIPSAFCGISGLMPTFGRVPKSGCLPLGFTLDHIGPMAGSAADCALMMNSLAGYHPSDVTAWDVPVPDYTHALTGDLTGVKIGMDRLDRFVGEEEDPAVPELFDAAVTELKDRGAEIVPLEIPLYQEMTVALMCIVAGEALAFHLPDAQSQLHNYVRSNRVAMGSHTFVSAADYVQAQRVRRVVHKAISATFQDVDLIVTPIASAGAFTFPRLEEGLKTFFKFIHTAYWDATGNPALSVPMGFTADGLPLALQIAGRPFEEELVLKAGDAFQRETAHHLQRPALQVAAG